MGLYGDGLSNVLIYNIKLVFLPDHAPYDGDIFDYDIERDGQEGAANAQDEPEQAKPVHRKWLDDTEHVHVDVDGANESAKEVYERGTRYGTQPGENYVGSWQR